MSGHPLPSSPLHERFCARDRPIHLTGLQALARLPLEQIRRDRRGGLRVGGFISGYPGSPLASFDGVLRQISPLLREHDLRFEAGINEELAAAAVAGSQFVDLFPHSDFDGAIGMWFGKAPGVDRCLDVFRHSNFAGVSRFGGAVAVAGDDPGCKSSSLPSQSDRAFAHARIPLLVPGSAGELLDLGLHAFTLSRFAGIWAGLKVVADVCDGGEILTLRSDDPIPQIPCVDIAGTRFSSRLDPRLLPPMVLEIERDLVYARLEAARRYVYENVLDRTHNMHGRDRVGIVAAGVHFRQLQSALEMLRVDESELAALGVRLLKMACVFPVEGRRLREFAGGLESVIVLDDRCGQLEEQIRSVLYDTADPPRVLGQTGPDGAPWLPRDGALRVETLACDLGDYLADACEWPQLRERSEGIREIRRAAAGPLAVVRRPHFCSGCPHLESTRVPDGAAAAGGIGCHTMTLLSDREMRFFGAMGSEGAHWNGLSDFVDTPHLFQNLGDGTYFHSGRQAVRACVEAGSNITFKLLYNGAIAMTGGQTAVGEKPLHAVVEDLLSDGVRHVSVVTRDRRVRKLARKNARVSRIRRDDGLRAMEGLSAIEGVTVYIYDELCANEKQRRQRRGQHPPPARRIHIQRDVCEGCGDCGRVSECLSVRPVQTSLGRKTEIHQGSCAQDETCTRGDCPAFIDVPDDAAYGINQGLPAASLALVEQLAAAPEPTLPSLSASDGHSIVMVGIGSTGVVTVGAVLMAAARHAGFHATHLDQTGLAQRGGRVTSHVKLSRRPQQGSAHVTWGSADTLLAFDPLGAADPAGLVYCSKERTATIAHSALTPTAGMVTGTEPIGPSASELCARLRTASRRFAEAPAEEVATAVLGQPLATNMVLLGVAYQDGALPLDAQAIESGIREVGTAVDTNLTAFRLGRVLGWQPDTVESHLSGERIPSVGDNGNPSWAQALYGAAWESVEAGLRGRRDPASGSDLVSLVAAWACDLHDYQDERYGLRYLQTLAPLVAEELAQGTEGLVVSPIVARELYRLMAYKDEYEVARLHLRGPYRRWLDERCGGRAKVHFWLQPPVLKALGLNRKLRLGPWFEPFLEALAALKFLRRTRFDPFGRGEVRAVERELVAWYGCLTATLASGLESIGVGRAAEIASRVAQVRGYEALKTSRAAEIMDKVDKELESAASPLRVDIA